MLLHTLVKQILKSGNAGVSKVKLAKLVYFTHKALIKAGKADIEAIEYQRLPLGPVPVNFFALDQKDWILVKTIKTGLEFDTTLYSLKDPESVKQDEDIALIVNKLNALSTSVLVQASHKDIAWIEHRNGEQFFINKQDLNKRLIASPLGTVSNENRKIQALLMDGLLNDIVDESSWLEYPNKYK